MVMNGKLLLTSVVLPTGAVHTASRPNEVPRLSALKRMRFLLMEMKQQKK